MYESFYGLKEKPFNLLPDPEYVYMSLGHENAYTHLEYAIRENKGFVVITGEIGSGKTTLINLLLQKIPQEIKTGVINNPGVSPKQFLKAMCREFELEAGKLNKAELIDLFNAFLLKQFADRRQVLLIIDEAQNLPNKTIEEIRMLSNLETEKHHLIQIMLVGQPELKYKLQGQGLAQFVQRVTVHCHLDGLQKVEAKQYIQHRLKIGGAQNLNIFNEEAIEAVYRYSRGVPRIINTLCDTALVYGFADDLHTIDQKVIDDVVETREIGGISHGSEGNGEPLSPAIPVKDVAWPKMNRRVQSLEKRIRLLESATAKIDEKFDLLVKSSEKRDQLTLELMKMLHHNIENRNRLTMKYARLILEKERKKEER